jgi:hypothetical protein
LSEFLRTLEQATGGMKITASELSRGLLALVLQTEDEILRSAAEACAQVKKHPATADHSGKEVLEGELAAIVFDAVKRASSRRATLRYSDMAGNTPAPLSHPSLRQPQTRSNKAGL